MIVSKQAIQNKYHQLISSGWNEEQAKASIQSLFGLCDRTVEEVIANA
jgi:hypothetical protein